MFTLLKGSLAFSKLRLVAILILWHRGIPVASLISANYDSHTARTTFNNNHFMCWTQHNACMGGYVWCIVALCESFPPALGVVPL